MNETTDDEKNVIHVNFGEKADSVDESASSSPPPASESEAAAHLEKLRIFQEMIEHGTVMVTLDARRSGVQIPKLHEDEFRLNLNFCHLFRIPDFEYDSAGVRASLSFQGRDRFCDIPWSAVYMMRSHVDNEVVVFPHDLPPEMMALIPQIERAMQESAEADSEPGTAEKPNLKVVTEEDSEENE